MNRGVKRARLFDTDADYQDLLGCMAHAQDRNPIRLLAYCVMPNHFHCVVWPSDDTQVSEFMKLTTGRHARRWHFARGSIGTGAVYQGRFKAFAVQTSSHFLTVCRYVEQNALRSGLVVRAEEWPWSSLSQRCKKLNVLTLSDWPIPQPSDWMDHANTLPEVAVTNRIRLCVKRGRPLGTDDWVQAKAVELGVEKSLQPLGRRKKKK